MRLLPTSVRVALATLPVAALLATSAPSAFAQVTSYTSSASFLAAVQPGFYTETFSAGTANTYSTNGFGYTVSAAPSTSGVYHNNSFIGTNLNTDALTITFTTGNVTAVGGNFYNTDINDAFVASAPVTLTLNFADSTSTPFTFTPTAATTYNGYTSNKVITSIVQSASPTASFVSIDNLTAGTKAVTAAATPEPGTVALLGAGVLPLIGMAVRRRKSA